MTTTIKDPSSTANFTDYVTEKFHITWDINFKDHLLTGSLLLTLKILNKDKKLQLDGSRLHIKNVQLKGRDLRWRYVEGSGLEIDMDTEDDCVTLEITYSTTTECTALQWLTPDMTKGKRHPYMFSQCQAIHARSLLPCQDTPAVKAPYTAEVTAPSDLNVLMSAKKLLDRTQVNENGTSTHYFEQSVPIPSYLVAIVSGNLVKRDLSPRIHVWSEPEMIEAAADEFAETERQIQTAESLCGPYEWGVYDMLVLPPSFPYGGMENPCLTFLTPTLLAGDRSLVNVVAHEISHSWTGNLVTNSNWEHFWLNEGHTVYLERLIQDRLYGKPTRDMFMCLGLNELEATMDQRGRDDPLTKLVVDLKGVDPDDAFSRVPYEKGSLLLYYLETLVGKDNMLDWLKAYIQHFRRKSLDTETWKKYFLDFMINEKNVSASTLNCVDWDNWFFAPGDIPFMPTLDRELTESCQKLADDWSAFKEVPAAEKDTDLHTRYTDFSSTQKQVFLRTLKDKGALAIPVLSKLRVLYGMDAVRNCEIKCLWLEICIQAKFNPCVSFVLEFVNSIGRMKYVRPLYRGLYKWEEKRQIAIDNFQANRQYMHPLTATMTGKDLHLIE